MNDTNPATGPNITGDQLYALIHDGNMDLAVATAFDIVFDIIATVSDELETRTGDIEALRIHHNQLLQQHEKLVDECAQLRANLSLLERRYPSGRAS